MFALVLAVVRRIGVGEKTEKGGVSSSIDRTWMAFSAEFICPVQCKRERGKTTELRQKNVL